ncbi:MAG: TlpA family protein disulfide reductase [Bryobacterales bacterium]|nr:TlpA family protein disulfide reductase [Bryobacterales bacterium]
MATTLRISLASLQLACCAVAFEAADGTAIRAPLQPSKARKPAPDCALKDSTGATVKLKAYRGKVVLLNFWATWCHGCKQEIPWFAEFETRYREKGFAAVGVSLDEGGWKVVKPFLDGAHVPYRMVLGDDAVAKRYAIDSLPDTFLIDRRGKVAAVYRSGMVDRANLEANIRALLSRH